MDFVEPPRDAFPELSQWQAAGMHDPVFRAVDAEGNALYVRADDGSGPTLGRLAAQPDLPAPRLLDQRQGWLLLEALPGVPLHDPRWRERPADAARVIADALGRLAAVPTTHGDMCVPNILGDLATVQLSGIVDWRYAERFDRVIDVASAVWSCGYNGYPPDVAVTVLRAIGWPRTDRVEVKRLARVWIELAGPPHSERGGTLNQSQGG